ncbi:MAG: hypothetical protein Q8J68_13575, partial [Methanolobus sp.]|nr:hypothetical protein [Methanolobus sp.]
EKDLLDAFTLQIKNGYEAELNIARNKISPLIDRYRKEASNEEKRKRLAIFENYQQQITSFEELIKFIYNKVEQMKKHNK